MTLPEYMIVQYKYDVFGPATVYMNDTVLWLFATTVFHESQRLYFAMDEYIHSLCC